MLLSSTPTVGTPTAATPSIRPDSKAALACASCGGHSGGLGAHHDEPLEPAELPVEGAQQPVAHAAEELPARRAARR